jgi:hypothetical protein
MQALGVTTLQDYYRSPTVKPTRQAELIALLNEITVGETCFFRNHPQLDALRSVVLPHIVEANLGALTEVFSTTPCSARHSSWLSACLRAYPIRIESFSAGCAACPSRNSASLRRASEWLNHVLGEYKPLTKA